MMIDIWKPEEYVYKVYTNFRDFNVSQDHIECESFTVIFINSLLVYDNWQWWL